MPTTRLLVLAIAFLVLQSAALCQNPQLRTKNASLFPTVTFTLVHWGKNPPYYSIALDSTGSATYQSFPASDEKTGIPYTVEFEATASTRSTIFRLAEGLHFFKGRFRNVNRPSRSTTVKTLTFQDGTTDNQITFTSSGNPAVQQLTSLFRNVSLTLEFGRRLSNLQQQHKPGIADELKRMERMARQGQLRELPAVAPVLSGIASDATLEGVPRQRAQAILNFGPGHP